MNDTATQNWTYNDYLAYLMIYAASADLNFHDSEIETIRKRVGDECYDKVMEVFGEGNDMTKIQVIMDFKEKFIPDDETKQKVLDDMQSVFNADEDYGQAEQSIFVAVRKLL